MSYRYFPMLTIEGFEASYNESGVKGFHLVFWYDLGEMGRFGMITVLIS